MTEKKYARLLRTILVSGGAFLLNCAIHLVLPPFITERVGAEAYGFVSLSRNFVQYAAILTTAINSFSARHIAVEYHQGRLREANVFFSSAFYGNLFLGSGLFAVLTLCTLLLEKLLHVPPQLVGDVKLLFLFVSLNFFVATLFAVWNTAAMVKNKLDVAGVFKALSYAAEAVVLLALYRLCPARVCYVGVGLLIQSLVLIFGNVWLHRKNTPELVVKRLYYSAAAIKRLVADGVWTSLNSLGETLNSGLDLLVCNLLLTPLDMGYLAIAKTVHGMFSSLFALIGQAFQPIFLKSYANGEHETLMRELKLSMKLSGMFGNIAYAGFVVLGMVFYRLWLPGQDIELIYRLSIIQNITIVATGTVFPLFYIYFLTVKKQLPTILTILGGLLNVAGMYILIRGFHVGVTAVVWTTVVIMIVINFVTNPLYMAYVLHEPWHVFYPNIARNVLSLGIMLSAFRGLSLLYLPDSWLTLALCACAYALLGTVLHILVAFDRRERAALMAFARRRPGRWL